MAPVNLTLTSASNIVNAGTISSSASLAMTAATSINNSGVVHAVNNVNLTAPAITNGGSLITQTGNLTIATQTLANSGLIQSLLSNVMVQALNSGLLNVDNTGGKISALDKVCFTNDVLQSSPESVLQGIAVTGGTVSGDNINFYSPTNEVDVSTDQLNGTVNLGAGESSVQVQSGSLNIGSLDITGDPIFALAGNGTLTINSPWANAGDASGGTFSTSG